jgi:hypothetical protein
MYMARESFELLGVALAHGRWYLDDHVLSRLQSLRCLGEVKVVWRSNEHHVHRAVCKRRLKVVREMGEFPLSRETRRGLSSSTDDPLKAATAERTKGLCVRSGDRARPHDAESKLLAQRRSHAVRDAGDDERFSSRAPLRRMR